MNMTDRVLSAAKPAAGATVVITLSKAARGKKVTPKSAEGKKRDGPNLHHPFAARRCDRRRRFSTSSLRQSKPYGLPFLGKITGAMVRRVISLGAAVIALCALGAPSSGATPATIGGTPATANTGSGCSTPTGCTFFQAEDIGSPSWAAPSDGVITSYAVRQGTTLDVGDTVQLKVFRPVGGSKWLVVGESPVGTFWNCVCGPIQDTFPARVAVKAGDRIGVAVHISGNTDLQVTPGAVGEKLATVTGVPATVGSTLVPLNLLASSAQINLRATIESDADGDGFGDDSQDLCPGNPARGDSGCSGQVVGSKFQVPYTSNTSCSGPPGCVQSNSAVPGGSAASPISGVLVRWRMYSFSPGQSFKLDLLRPTSGGLQLVTDTAMSTGSAPTGIVTSPELQIPIKVGDRIGLETILGNYYGYQHPGAGAWGVINPAVPVGTTATEITVSNDFQFLFGADVEADADADGFGDETQDGCPTDPAELVKCPQPVISGFKFSPSSFKVQSNGPVVSARRLPRGSKLKLSLSKASHVSFVVNLKAVGRRQGKHGCTAPTRKNRNAPKCTYFPKSWTFARELPAGASSIAFSGRMIKKHKKQLLPAGPYVVTAYPLSSLSRVGGKTAKTTMKIAR